MGIPRADFFGESYGASTALTIAIDHPELVGRVAICGATFGPPAEAFNTAMLRFDQPPTPDSRGIRYQKEMYQKVAPDPAYWSKIWEKVAAIKWNGFSSEQLASIQAPVLVVAGDHDFVCVEHAAAAARRIPNGELCVIPDASHFVLFSEPERVIPAVKHFLAKPAKRLPLATAEMGYHPGETR